MSHLDPILNKQKEVVASIMENFADTRAVGEIVESWTNTHPNYAALMSKHDEIIDYLNEFKSDLTGKITDLQNLT